MPTFNYPYIRDIVTIDDWVQKLCNEYVGAGPIYLIGREVRFAPGTGALRVARGIPLVIVADIFDGTGGLIDARGVNSAAVGASGAHGQFPNVPFFDDPVDGVQIPINPGTDGAGGGNGDIGGTGATVTVYCRRSVNVTITVAGGIGAQGGSGGAGGAGVHGVNIAAHTRQIDNTPGDPFDFDFTTEEVPERTIAGTPGGNGGPGGAGGTGGTGGTINFTSIVDETPPEFVFHGGEGGPGGFGGAAGVDGNLSDAPASAGADGPVGNEGAVGTLNHTNRSEVDFVAGLRPVLDSPGGVYANFWAPYRIAVGNFFYHRYNPSIPEAAGLSRLAVVEFARALELQPDNVEALRLQTQLVGSPQVDPATGDVIFVGGGNNALGLHPKFDVVPRFDDYMRPFTAFGSQVLTFLVQGTAALLAATTLDALREMVNVETIGAEVARLNLDADLRVAIGERQVAATEVPFVERQLQQTINEISAAINEMNESPFTIGAFVGTVAEVALAVVGVAAAIPTFGASLVALVPAVVALVDALDSDADSIIGAVLEGTDPDTEEIEKAYEKVGKKSSDVVAAGKKIVDFVKVVQRLTASTTPNNAKHVALVKRAAELIHQLLLANNKVSLADQRVAATSAKLSRAATVVAAATKLGAELAFDEASIRQAGMIAISVAQSRTDTLAGMAFRAQRSVEIYTLQPQERNVHLDAGMLHPDVWRRFDEGQIGTAELHGALILSWGRLLQPIEMQAAYHSFFTVPLIQDRLRLRFDTTDPAVVALRANRRFNFRVEASSIPTGRAHAKVTGVKLAMVGASHPDPEVSCEVRHGGKYEQRLAGATIDVQLLNPLFTIVSARLERLEPDEEFGIDSPDDGPDLLPFWGRGVGGEWEVSIVGGKTNTELDLTGLTEIQVWIDYQFRP